MTVLMQKIEREYWVMFVHVGRFANERWAMTDHPLKKDTDICNSRLKTLSTNGSLREQNFPGHLMLMMVFSTENQLRNDTVLHIAVLSGYWFSQAIINHKKFSKTEVQGLINYVPKNDPNDPYILNPNTI